MGSVHRCVRYVLLLGALLLWGCAGSGTAPVANAPGPVFKAEERAAIQNYYAGERRRPAQAPAPMFKPGDRLDSGLRPQPLPSELKVRLPDLQAPYTRLVVGADVILLNRDSHVIADVIPAVAY